MASECPCRCKTFVKNGLLSLKWLTLSNKSECFSFTFTAFILSVQFYWNTPLHWFRQSQNKHWNKGIKIVSEKSTSKIYRIFVHYSRDRFGCACFDVPRIPKRFFFFFNLLNSLLRFFLFYQSKSFCYQRLYVHDSLTYKERERESSVLYFFLLSVVLFCFFLLMNTLVLCEQPKQTTLILTSLLDLNTTLND